MADHDWASTASVRGLHTVLDRVTEDVDPDYLGDVRWLHVEIERLALQKRNAEEMTRQTLAEMQAVREQLLAMDERESLLYRARPSQS